MRAPNYQWIAQMGAALGVIISLGLVAYELKQSRDVAVAELTLSMNSEMREAWRVLFDRDAYERARVKIEKDEYESLTATEKRNWQLFGFYDLHTAESFHYLQMAGLLGEEEWDAIRVSLKALFEDVVFMEALSFPLTKQEISFRQSFLDELNFLYTEWEAEQAVKTR